MGTAPRSRAGDRRRLAVGPHHRRDRRSIHLRLRPSPPLRPDPRCSVSGMGNDDIRAFRVDVPDSVLDDLRERLARTRWPDQIPGSGWGYGTDLAYLQDLCDYWRTKFDWRVQEQRFNRWPHFLTEIDGQQIHFIHARCDDPDALPLIVTHGWPGSVAEFVDVIEPLCENVPCCRPVVAGLRLVGPDRRARLGCAPRRASVGSARWRGSAMPGTAHKVATGGRWCQRSSPRSTPNTWSVCTATCCWRSRMTPAALRSTHRNLPTSQSAGEFMKEGSAYQEIQGKNPQTLAYGLSDSPAGLAGWIVEKFRAWTDNNGNPEDAISRDQILTNITVYWVTETINSSTRLYCESRRTNRFGPMDEKVTVPTAAAIFPKEIVSHSRVRTRSRGSTCPVHPFRPRRSLRRARGTGSSGR